MQLFKQWPYALLLVVGLFVAVSSCKNNDTPAPVLSVTSVNPTSAPVGSTIVLTGTNFNTTPASNTVSFGGVPATVLAATSTQLTVAVPVNAGSAITVTANGATVTAPSTFNLGTKPVVNVSGTLTAANSNWTAGNIYVLQGFVLVPSGVTLNIQAGTVIRGAAKEADPSGALKGGTLIVQAGGKINAVGTASAPIVFTSNKAAGSRTYGDWGGVVVIGRATYNLPSATTFEGGIPGTIGNANVDTDNSGTLQYVRIEFGGIALTAGSEINGLTMYGVGSGTVIDHVQVSYSGDDSYEWFGGTVNAKYLIALRGFDDDWDTDWGFTGKVQYALSLRDPNVADQSASNGFESDNLPGTGIPTGLTPGTLVLNNGLPLTAPVFANVSNFAFNTTPSNSPAAGGSGPYQSGMHLRRNTNISIFNTLIYGYPEGLRLEGLTTTYANVTANTLQLRGIVMANVGIPSSTTAIRGAGDITNDQAQAFFNTAAYGNQVIAVANVGTLLLNAANFNLTAPNFLPGTGSPLLTGAIWDGKGADAFFTKETFKGAFGTTNWTAGWANFDPQTTNYDR